MEMARHELRDRINDSPFYRLMGIRLVEIEPGRSRLEADVGNQHLNVYGTAHGGLCAALVDCAVGTALIGDLGQVTRPSPTVEMKINYLAPVTGGRLVAEGRLLHRGRTLAVGMAEIRDGEGTLVAVGTATYLSGGKEPNTLR
ncbi:MAG: PaaI family thioesterase [Bacillota bacterium]